MSDNKLHYEPIHPYRSLNLVQSSMHNSQNINLEYM